MGKLICALVAACALASPAHAELIKLRSGQEVNAKVLKRNEKSVTVDWHGVPVTYFFSDIESIDGAVVEGASPALSRAAGEAPPAPLAPEDEALMRETIELSGLTAHLDELEQQTQGGVKGHEDDERLKKLTPAQREQFLKVLETSFNTERMSQDIETSFRRSYHRAHAAEAAAWLRSALGRRLNELEREPRDPKALELFIAQLEQDPPSSARVQLAQRFLEASGAADAAIEMGVAMATAMAQALDTQGKLKEAELRAGIAKAKQVYNNEYREQIEAALMANFLFVYRTVPDEDLDAYVTFMESGAGQWLNRATISALTEAMGQAAVRMSRDLLPMMEEAKRNEAQAAP